MYLGEFSTTGKTFDFGFTTVNSSGVPTAFSSGGVTVYRDNSTVSNTTGITLTSTFAGVVGLQRVRIAMAVTSTFYDAGGEYMAVISCGAASESLAGYTLAHWAVRRNTPVLVSTAVSISTASLISTAQTMASVGSITSTVQADVALWRGTAPSTLGTGAFLVPSSTAAILSITNVNSTIQADVRLWVGTAPSTLGPNSNVQISTASNIASASSVTTVGAVASTIQADVALWRGVAPSTLGTASHVRVDLAAVATAAALEINAEVADVIRTDSTGAPAGAPPASTTLEGKVGFLYAALRHGLRVGSSGKTFLDASSAVQWVKGIGDDGSTYFETLASTST